MIALLLSTLLPGRALAAPYPIELPASADPAAWQAAAQTAGLTLGAHTSGPGGTLRPVGGQWELLVLDQDGTPHRVLLPPPDTAEERQAALSLAASLIRPARWSMPPLPVVGAPVALAPVAEEPVEAVLPAPAAPEAALPEAALPEEAPPEAALPEAALPEEASPEAALPEVGAAPPIPPPLFVPERSPVDLSVGHQVTVLGGASARPGMDAGGVGALQVAAVLGRYHAGIGVHSSSSPSATQWASEVGGTVHAGFRPRQALQLSGALGLVVQDASATCPSCSTEMSGFFGEEISISADHEVNAIEEIRYVSRALQPVLGLEAACVVPVRPRLSLLPALRLQADLYQPPWPEEAQLEALHPVQFQAAVGVMIHDPEVR